MTGMLSQHLLLAHMVVELLDLGLCREYSRIHGGRCPGCPVGVVDRILFNPFQCSVWAPWQYTHSHIVLLHA